MILFLAYIWPILIVLNGTFRKKGSRYFVLDVNISKCQSINILFWLPTFYVEIIAIIDRLCRVVPFRSLAFDF